MNELKELFQPIKIGNKIVKNRIALPPMILGEATPEGYVTQYMINRYREVAEGGAGFMIIEGVSLDSPCAKGIGGLIAYNNNIQGINNIADACKLNGAVPIMQLIHCGRQALPEANGGVQPVSCSAIPFDNGKEVSPVPHAATLEELEEIKQAYVDAAIFAQKAGMEGVEIHSAHGYLLSCFLSAKANNRTDKYGGDFAHRMAYPVEVAEAVKKAVKPGFIVGVRISANYLAEGEPTVDEMIEYAKALEAVGIDYLNCSGGTYETHFKQSPPIYMPRNINKEEAGRMKAALHIPVLVAGGISVPEEANAIIKEGKADLVCLGRQLFADPFWPKKVKLGKLDEIRPCIRCNMEFGDSFVQHQCRCSVNFRLGREQEYRLDPAKEKKKVMIVGGGPGGMEAARVAAIRGHEVHLYEKADKLGGGLYVASAAGHKEEIERLCKYFIRQMELNKVNVHLNTEVTSELVDQVKPDALIVSIGSHPAIPPIKGIDKKNVLVCEDVLFQKVQTGDTCIVAGGGCSGIDLVHQLTEKGKKVILIEMRDLFGADLDIISWQAINVQFKQLVKEGKLELHLSTKIKEITDDGVIVEDADGKESTIKADNIINALGYVPNNKEAQDICENVADSEIIGDCRAARRIRNAIHEGFVAAYNI